MDFGEPSLGDERASTELAPLWEGDSIRRAILTEGKLCSQFNISGTPQIMADWSCSQIQLL